MIAIILQYVVMNIQNIMGFVTILNIKTEGIMDNFLCRAKRIGTDDYIVGKNKKGLKCKI